MKSGPFSWQYKTKTGWTQEGAKPKQKTQILGKLQQVVHKQTKSAFDSYIEDQHGNRKNLSMFAHDKYGNVVLQDDKELHKEFHVSSVYNVVRGVDHNIHLGYHGERVVPKFANSVTKINSSHAQPKFAPETTEVEPKADTVQAPPKS